MVKMCKACGCPKSKHNAENESAMDACERCYACPSWKQSNPRKREAAGLIGDKHD